MKTVLLVEDEKLFLASLLEGLKVYHDEFQTLTAVNGREAIKILEKQTVDLVVTDLMMPVLDGFELIAYIVGRFPRLPIIVVSAFSQSDVEPQIEKLTFSYLQKPLDFNVLTEKIRAALQITVSDGQNNATLPSYLRLLEIEGKSCTLRVASKRDEGFLYIKGGQIYNSDCAGLTGEAAVKEILSWSDVSLEISKPYNISQRSIKTLLTDFLPLKPPRRLTQKTVTTAAVTRIQPPLAPVESNSALDFSNYKLFAGAESGAERIKVLNSIEQALGSLLKLDGAIAAAVVDADSGQTLGAIGGGLDIEKAALENAAFLSNKIKLLKRLAINDKIEDILTNFETQYHLIRPLTEWSELFIYLVVNRENGNLVLARRSLSEVERQISAVITGA